MKKILLASGCRRNKYKEITVNELVDEYDYCYYSNFMERWARDMVGAWVRTDDKHQKIFVTEYLKIAHNDLIIDEL